MCAQHLHSLVARNRNADLKHLLNGEEQLKKRNVEKGKSSLYRLIAVDRIESETSIEGVENGEETVRAKGRSLEPGSRIEKEESCEM